MTLLQIEINAEELKALKRMERTGGMIDRAAELLFGKFDDEEDEEAEEREEEQ